MCSSCRALLFSLFKVLNWRAIYEYLTESGFSIGDHIHMCGESIIMCCHWVTTAGKRWQGTQIHLVKNSHISQFKLYITKLFLMVHWWAKVQVNCLSHEPLTSLLCCWVTRDCVQVRRGCHTGPVAASWSIGRWAANLENPFQFLAELHFHPTKFILHVIVDYGVEEAECALYQRWELLSHKYTRSSRIL